MKILSVNNTADLYGSSRCMERVFGRFAEDGHEVHAVLPERGPLVALLKARGVVVHLHSGMSIIDRSQLKTAAGCLRFCLSLPGSVFFLVRLIRRLHIDLVHTNSVVLPAPSIAALVTRKPHVWHIRELLGEFGSLWRPYQRWVHHLSSAVVAISLCVREQFQPDVRNKIQVIYDGVGESTGVPDPARQRAFRAMFPADATVVGVVGRIKWHRKGQEVLVRAASLLRERHPEARYVFVGKPSPGNEDHEARLRDLIAEYGLEDVVMLAGEIEDTASVFAALDIAVAPPVQPEPFGCVVLEAMAVGTSVVGSRAGGIAEQIVHGETGLLFAPGDPEELASALDLLLRDSERRKRLADAGQQRAASEFNLETTIEKMAALVGRLGAEKHRSVQAVAKPAKPAKPTRRISREAEWKTSGE